MKTFTPQPVILFRSMYNLLFPALISAFCLIKAHACTVMNTASLRTAQALSCRSKNYILCFFRTRSHRDEHGFAPHGAGTSLCLLFPFEVCITSQTFLEAFEDLLAFLGGYEAFVYGILSKLLEAFLNGLHVILNV